MCLFTERNTFLKLYWGFLIWQIYLQKVLSENEIIQHCNTSAGFLLQLEYMLFYYILKHSTE